MQGKKSLHRKNIIIISITLSQLQLEKELYLVLKVNNF